MANEQILKLKWLQAALCSAGTRGDDLADTVIAPAGAEAASAALSDLRDGAERLGKYLARLREVRSRRAAMEVSRLHTWHQPSGKCVTHCPTSVSSEMYHRSKNGKMAFQGPQALYFCHGGQSSTDFKSGMYLGILPQPGPIELPRCKIVPHCCSKGRRSCQLLCVCAQPAAAGSTELAARCHHCPQNQLLRAPLKACPGCCYSFARPLKVSSSPWDALNMLPLQVATMLYCR